MGVECIEYGSGQFALYGVIHEYGVAQTVLHERVGEKLYETIFFPDECF